MKEVPIMENENTETSPLKNSNHDTEEWVSSSSDPVKEDETTTKESSLEGDEQSQASGENELKEDEEVNAHTKEIESLQKEKDDLYDRMLRIQAEYDNFKKRSEKEKIFERKYKSQDLATELLPVIDNFKRALQVEPTEETKSMLEGLSMIYEQLNEALQSQGVEEIEAEGNQFDPNLHHAVMQVEDGDKDSNIIIEELQKGYILNDRVIRPAMVKVNK